MSRQFEDNLTMIYGHIQVSSHPADDVFILVQGKTVALSYTASYSDFADSVHHFRVNMSNKYANFINSKGWMQTIFFFRKYTE